MTKSTKTLIKHIPDFLDYCEVEKGLSPVSTRNYHNFLKVFSGWLKIQDIECLLPHELTPEHIWDYRLYLSRKQDDRGAYIKKTTQSYYLRALRNFMNFFTHRDIQAIPSGKINLPKLTDKDKKIKFLKYEQVEKLLLMPNTETIIGLRDRALLETLFATGMRVSELTSLNADRFKVIHSKDQTQEIDIIGKGGSVRPVYLPKKTVGWLTKYIDTRKDLFPPLFINYRKNSDPDDEHRLTPRSIAVIVKKYTNMAGLPVDATPHTLRHSYATDLLEQGADIRSVQELLGHKDIGTTQIYTHVTNKQLKDTYNKFHSGENK